MMAKKGAIKLCDLAAQVFPDTSSPRSASQRLRRWIHSDAELARELAGAGYVKRQRLLTRRQANMVAKRIGVG